MIPLQITFRDIETSDFITTALQERVDRLERFCDYITDCQIVVSAPHKHHRKGRIYHVQIRLHLPKKNLFVSRDAEQDEAHTDVYVAIADAFKEAERLLEDYARRRRGSEKRGSKRIIQAV